MKINNLVFTAAVAALAAITFTVTANGALLSPRAAGNQIKIATGVSESALVAVTAPSSIALSPRAAGNQIVHLSNAGPTLVKCLASGNPKYVAMVGDKALAACCNLTLAECPTMNACRK